MATVNFINRKKSQTHAGMRAVLNYTQQDKKTMFEGRKLVSGLNCSPASVYQEFVNTKLQYGKDSQRMYYHFVQSFPPNEKIDPQTAHEIALKLAGHYKSFEVLVATHVDREHIHSHFIFNSVSFESGKKLHQSAHAIQQLRQESDNLCLEYGLSVCQPKERRTQPVALGEYHSAAKGNSWKMQLVNSIDECMKYATSKESLISMLELRGYSVKWSDNRKYITYITPCGRKCRDNHLHEEKYLKEIMEHELRIRNEIITGGTEKTQSAPARANANTSSDTRELPAQDRDGIRTANSAQFPARTAKSDMEPEPQYPDPIEYAGNPERAGSNQYESGIDPTNLVTGWEIERNNIFFPENQAAADLLFTSMAINHSPAVRLAGNLVQLGKSLERTSSTAPVRDATTTPQLSAAKKRKLMLGQKEDDHSGYGFEIKL